MAGFCCSAGASASLACGLAGSQGLLVVARAVQGLGGAVVSAIALSLIMNLFTEPVERAKAMGIYGFVMAGGGSVGALLGGLLTDALSWHWVFLVNIPIGVAVYALTVILLRESRAPAGAARLDVGGAVTVTASLLLAVYAVVNGNEAGWTSAQTLTLLGAAAGLLALFLALETWVHDPLMPLRLFRLRSVATANVVGILWSAAMFAWFFVSALYLQLVLGYSAMQVGLAFLPANLIMAAFSLGLSAKMVMRFGIRMPLAAGLALTAAGLALFALSPVDGSFALHVLPGMALLGIGCGMAMNPVLLAAMSDVPQSESGLAVLASLAAARTDRLLALGADSLAALNGGYHIAFAIGAVFAAVASLLSAVLLRAETNSLALAGEAGTGRGA